MNSPASNTTALNTQSMAAIEADLLRVQESTRTTFPAFIRLHDWLRLHVPWYYRWHMFRYIRWVHISTLFVYLLGIGLYVYNWFLTNQKLTSTIYLTNPDLNAVDSANQVVVSPVSSTPSVVSAIAFIIMIVSVAVIVGATLALIKAHRDDAEGVTTHDQDAFEDPGLLDQNSTYPQDVDNV